MKEENIIVIIMVVAFGIIMFWVLFDAIFEGKIYKAICEILNAQNVAPNKMSFDSFVAFYNIAPTQYELKQYYIIYTHQEKIEAPSYWNCPHVEYKYYFSFTFYDWFKYNHFRKQILKQKQNDLKNKKRQSNYNEYQEALKYIKQDIEQFKQSKPWDDIKL